MSASIYIKPKPDLRALTHCSVASETVSNDEIQLPKLLSAFVFEYSRNNHDLTTTELAIDLFRYLTEETGVTELHYSTGEPKPIELVRISYTELSEPDYALFDLLGVLLKNHGIKVEVMTGGELC